jgi:4-amino-4-deoxy-L-arabinose transferase-like glycosyltransferase
LTLFAASKSLGLGTLAWKFIFSRAILCITGILIAFACRYMIPEPISWFEVLSCVVLLLLWPPIELLVHTVMHRAVGTRLYIRHKEHHEEPHQEKVIGPITTLLPYNVIAFPWLYLGYSTAASLTLVVLIAITIYEFVHFTTHFRYRPVTAWGNRIRKNHLLHHKNPSKHLEVVFPRSSSR